MSPARRRPSWPARHPSACRSSAATRWRDARRPATRHRPRTCSSDRPWVVVPAETATPRDVAVVECAGDGLWCAATHPGCRHARCRGGRDQPPAARPRGGPRGGGGGRDGRSDRPGPPVHPGPRRRRLAGHDPARPGRRRDGRRASSRPMPRRWPTGSATSRPSSTAGCVIWTPRTARTSPPSTARLTAARDRLGEARLMEEQVLVVPRDALPDRAGWYGLRTDGLDGFAELVARAGSYRPAAGDGGRSGLQADHPVPGPARRTALLPDASDAGRRRRPAPRPLLDRRRRAPQPGRRRASPAACGGSGPRKSWRTSSRPSTSWRCSTTTRPRSEPSTSGRSTSPMRRAAPVEIRETDKLTGSFVEAEEVAAVADRSRPGAALSSMPSRHAPTGPDPSFPRRSGDPTGPGGGRDRRCVGPDPADGLGAGGTAPARRPAGRARTKAALGPALDALGGEVVRIRSRDGLRLSRALAAGRARRVRRDGVATRSPRGDPAAPRLHRIDRPGPRRVRAVPAPHRRRPWPGLPRPRRARTRRPTTFGLREVEDVAGALAWLGSRGIASVALVGTSMGGITAIASVAVLGDGSLASADAEPDVPDGPAPPIRPRIVAIVADSVASRVVVPVASRLPGPARDLRRRAPVRWRDPHAGRRPPGDGSDQGRRPRRAGAAAAHPRCGGHHRPARRRPAPGRCRRPVRRALGRARMPSTAEPTRRTPSAYEARVTTFLRRRLRRVRERRCL